MNRILAGLAVLSISPATAPALGADSDTPPPSSYRQVMQAQYAARAAPLPQRPEEAQRVYDTYLKSIGQPVKGNITDTGSNAGMPSR